MEEPQAKLNSNSTGAHKESTEVIPTKPGVISSNLGCLEKDKLIEIVVSLQQTICKLQDDFQKINNLRLYHVERRLNMTEQYSRRDTLEITGIPMNIPDEKLEDEVIGIMKDTKVSVNRQPIKKMDIQATHRIGKKGTVICKVVNRKFIREALIKSNKLAGNTRYGGNTRLYINDSFCNEFRFLNYAIRLAKKSNNIFRYKVRNGVNFIQQTEDSSFIEIGHTNDLLNVGIEVPARD